MALEAKEKNSKRSTEEGAELKRNAELASAALEEGKSNTSVMGIQCYFVQRELGCKEGEQVT